MEAVDCDVMNDSRDRRRRGEMGLSLPPPSVSAAVPAAEEQMTPRSMLSRWLASIQNPISGGGGGGAVGCRVRFPRYRSKKRKEERREVVGPPLVNTTAVQAAGGGLVAPPLVSASVESVPEEQSVSSGMKAGELSLNLGLGVGLVFLLTKSANELNKMIELQKQMTLILKDIKDEMQRKKVPPSFTESNSHFVYSDSNYGMNENTSNSTISQHDRAPHHFVGEHGATESDRQSKCQRTSKKKPSVKMNQLEEEFEVELERLQHNVEGEISYVLPQPHRPEFVGENSDHSEIYDISFIEANETNDEESSRYGVSPRELERRLHELLELQQQQRIEELESALEYAERKLREREVEICWWKDTAKLVSKHKEEAHFR